jgi:hypothetical protein
MNWLKRKVWKWAANCESDERPALGSSQRDNKPEQDPILSFRIYSAVNGQLLEFRRFDRKTDNSISSTYIIEKDRNIGDYVNKCLSMELLK